MFGRQEPLHIGPLQHSAQKACGDIDAFARLKCQRPIGVGEAAWLRAIDDAGRFVDQWASLAVEFGWKPGDLFDVPREGKSGLVWYLAGETVRSIGRMAPSRQAVACLTG